MAKWTGVVTNKGAELLAAWAEGTTLNIYSAAAGTGTVAEAAMIAQTALAGQKQAASIVSHSKADGATGLKIQLQITAPSTGYTLNQFGIWAKVGSGEGKLLALFQNSEDIDVPSASDSPDFVYTFYGLIMISNTGSISVTVDASAVVTTATMQAAIAAAIADIPQPIIGTAPPTTSTVGVVGQTYIDTAAKLVYHCTGVYVGGVFRGAVVESEFNAVCVKLDNRKKIHPQQLQHHRNLSGRASAARKQRHNAGAAGGAVGRYDRRRYTGGRQHPARGAG